MVKQLEQKDKNNILGTIVPPPPPMAPITMTTEENTASEDAPVESSGRSALLDSIKGFKKTALKQS